MEKLIMSRCIAKTPPFKAELASRAPQEFLRIEFLKAIKNQRFLRSKSPQTNPAFQGGVNEKGFLIMGKKRIALNVRKAGAFSKGIGLMFKGRESDNLLFEFKRDVGISIHSFFVFFPFLALWLDSENKVLDSRIVKPFCFSVKPKKPFRKLVEIPFNEKNREMIKELMKN